MSKLCSVCGTENRDEAQFCRACGTAFSAALSTPAVAADGSSANACSECGFKNKPGIRYCANCGMSLAAPAAAASGSDDRAGVEKSGADDSYARSGPPPITYESFATVAPYTAPRDTDHSALFDEQSTPDIPDADAAIALRQQEGFESHGDTVAPGQETAAPKRAPMMVGIVVAALAAAGLAAWLFMGRSNPAPPQPGVTTAPVAPPVVAAPAPTPTPSPIIIEEAAPAPTVAASAAAPSAVLPAQQAPAGPLGPPPTAAAPLGAVPLGSPPTAAAPLPQLGDLTAEADAKRLAAEKRRDKAARDKAERDAKAKAAQDQREQTGAAQRAEQEAQSRRRAEEAQRARPSAAVPASPPPAVAQARGVREICAGRGTIAEAVCQSRQCGLAEHANEPICRQLRDADERRRNMQN